MKREYDFSKVKRGPVIAVPKGKVRLTIRLDEDVVGWFRVQVEKAGGGNYQTLINDALRQARCAHARTAGGNASARYSRGHQARQLAFDAADILSRRKQTSNPGPTSQNAV